MHLEHTVTDQKMSVFFLSPTHPVSHRMVHSTVVHTQTLHTKHVVHKKYWKCKQCHTANNDFRVACWFCHYPVEYIINHLRLHRLNGVSNCRKCHGILLDKKTSFGRYHVTHCAPLPKEKEGNDLWLAAFLEKEKQASIPVASKSIRIPPYHLGSPSAKPPFWGEGTRTWH